MGIVLYNTKSRKKEPLHPLEEGKIKMYVCGVTVYDYCHIGHARVMVVFDVVARYLRARGLDVTYVRNFTDVDDKIIRRAQENGESIKDLTERFIKAFEEDMDNLAVEKATIEPKATEHMQEMFEIIERLIDKGLAYEKSGDLFYSVKAFPKYGQLSGRNLADLEAGARVEILESKSDPLDFALWKSVKNDEPAWDSPWGRGRPGWHIECSAMSRTYLGDTFDIHGGGKDLVFPHHENEIAQTEGATGKPYVNYWMHNGFVNVLSESGEREKMSKSLGNFKTIRDLLEEFPGEVIRFFILNSHYRNPLDFGHALLESAQNGLDRLYTAMAKAEEVLGDLPEPQSPEKASNKETQEVTNFFSAMDDDFNTPRALASLFDLGKKINRLVGEKGDLDEIRTQTALLRGLGGVLGVLGQTPKAWFQRQTEGLIESEIETLILKRNEARKARNFAEADRIRDQLAEEGVTLLDGREGTRWRRS
ncbi:cysteine--tRNA ligase [Magnetococcales bacterium HHB-1]